MTSEDTAKTSLSRCREQISGRSREGESGTKGESSTETYA